MKRSKSGAIVHELKDGPMPDSIFAALEWIPIDEMPYEFEGVVELAGAAWFRAIAFTCKDLSDNDIRWWHIGDKAYEFDPPSNVTHWRKILPGPNE